MLKIYPAIVHREDGAYWIEFPDLEGCNTFGESLEQTFENAQEALGLYLAALWENGQGFPEAKDLSEIEVSESSDLTSYISVDVEDYLKSTKAVKKTLSLPEWLALEAERNNLSLSKVLQEGLKRTLSL